MAYATVEEVQKRIVRTISEDEERVCLSLLEDAAILIDAYNKDATEDAKKSVSCRMIIRAIGTGDEDAMMPIGASQGSMSALGYTQSWTVSSGGSIGQLYLDRTDKKMLGGGSRIGSSNPLEGLVCKYD